MVMDGYILYLKINFVLVRLNLKPGQVALRLLSE